MKRRTLLMSGCASTAVWAAPPVPRNASGQIRVTTVQTDVLRFPPRKLNQYDAIHEFGPHRGGVVIRIATDAGITGWAYSSFGMVAGGPETVKKIVDKDCAPVLLKQDPFMVRALRAKLWNALEYQGVGGVVHFAVSAIDIALWDIMGKALGAPVHKLLGGARDRIPAYSMAGWYYQGDKDNSKYKEEVAQAFNEGFRAVKVKVGRFSLEDDVRRIEIAKNLAGTDRKVMVDANQGFNTNEAIRRGRIYEKLGCFWYEEPLPPQRRDGYAELKRELDIRIATGENEYTKYGFLELLRQNAADVLQPDNRRAGGVTEWMEISAIADAFGVEIASHGGGPTNVHMLCAMPNAIFVETSGVSSQDRTLEKLRLVDGDILAPTSPGMGSELEPDYIEKNKVV